MGLRAVIPKYTKIPKALLESLSGMVVVVVVLVKRFMAREKRRQELRLRATV
jgi:hypothetical protein